MPNQIGILSAILRELHRQGFTDITTETANRILDATNDVVEAVSLQNEDDEDDDE